MASLLVPSAARALAVFEIFAREKRELSNTELAKFLELAESSCSDLVTRLIELGYMSRSPRTRKLYPTGRLAAIGREIESHDLIGIRLNDACEALRNRTGESALCGALRKRWVHVQAFSPGLQALRYTSARGDRISLHVSAMGKAILSCMSPTAAASELGDSAYEKVASDTVTEPSLLLEQVDKFRTLGYVLLENEAADGLAALAIAGHVNGQLLAFSVAGALPAIKARQADYLQALHDVCDALFDDPAQPG